MKTDFIDLAKQGGEYGRGDDQWPWYQTFRPWMANKTILDVGTGISKIKARLTEFGFNSQVTTHEASEDCVADMHGDIEHIESGFRQVVTCFDVVEHVKNYGRFVYNLARIASEHLIVTTPGFEITKNTNPCHWHEFLPDELCELIEATGMVFVQAFGSEWVEYPIHVKNFRTFTQDELKANFPMHPIAVVFRH